MAEEGTPPVQTEPTPASTAGEPTPPVTPAVETAPVSTTPPAEELPNGTREVDGGVAGYLEEKAKALAGKSDTPPPVETAAPVVPPVETPPVVPPVETPPATPPVEPVTPPVTPPPVESATPPATPPVEPEAPDRIRLKGLPDGHLVAAANEIARAEGITFEAAFARVTTKTSTPPAAPPAPGNTVRSRADVESDLEAARAERRNAANSADALEQGAAGKMVAAEERLEALQLELRQVDSSEQRAEQERLRSEETAFGRDVQKSKAQAIQYWPEAADEKGDFSKRMIELSELYEKDPLLAHHAYEATAPFFFADLVAKERGLSPAHLRPAAPATPPGTPPATPQPATPPPTKPAPVSQRAVVSPVPPAAGPASGAARTTQEAPKVDYGIEKIGSVADYEKVKKAVLLRPEHARAS